MRLSMRSRASRKSISSSVLHGLYRQVSSDDLAAFVLDSKISEDKYAVAARALQNMNELFDDIIEKSRAAGRSDADANIIDRLVSAHDDTDALSTDELVAFCVLLLFAGHETTAHFLATGLRALIQHPEQKNYLISHHDDAAVVTNAVNESLRYDGPILAISRHVLQDHEFYGKEFRRGQRVYLFNAAANRDGRVFARPDQFDLQRSNTSRMVGFGYGIHLCLGIHLARLEGEIALPRLLTRLNHLELADDMLDWTNTLVMRGPKHMRIRL